MTSLTTRQRDLLERLLSAEGPLGAAELAGELQLTARQVNYSLKGLRTWLAAHEIPLQVTPGVGVRLQCTPDALSFLDREVRSGSTYNLVLSASERQQLLLLQLLVAEEPQILDNLRRLAHISRTTLTKDIDRVGEVTSAEGLNLERRPNSGIWIEGPEQKRRQTMARLAWGMLDLGPPAINISHAKGLEFSLARDAHLLPLVAQVAAIVSGWNLQRTATMVAYAESQLDGRFSDDAVLYLTLALAIQYARVQQGASVLVEGKVLQWLKSLTIWPIATEVARRLSWGHEPGWTEHEVASIAMHFLAAPRNGRWPGDVAIDESYLDLIDELQATVAATYGLPHLADDSRLHDGLVTQVIPTCLRQRFDIWMPPALPGEGLSDRYQMEKSLSHVLAAAIVRRTGRNLAVADIEELALLLRAAAIRAHSSKLEDVLVICPSGMASAQLLVARIRARFPRLSDLQVYSLRELSAMRLQRADLCITTVPLPYQDVAYKVIQVHPLLLPEDVDAITRWLANAS